jgi:uncharacterized protein DUF6221
VSIESALSRLSAGLDRDEQLARGCIDDSPHWIATPEGVDQYEPGGPSEVVTRYFTQTPHPLANQHIANFDPDRVLRQVEAIRTVASLCDAMQHKDVGYCEILVLLASIYTEDTDEAGGTPA